MQLFWEKRDSSFWSPLYNDQMIPKPLTGSGLKNRENTKRSFYVWQCHYSMSLFFNPKTLRPRPNVSVFVWTWIFFLRLGPPSTHIRWKRSPKTDLFKNTLQPEWKFLKTPAFCLRVDGRRRRFSNTMVSYIIYRKSSIKHPGRLIFFKHFRAGVAYLNYSAKRINGNKGSCFL